MRGVFRCPTQGVTHILGLAQTRDRWWRNFTAAEGHGRTCEGLHRNGDPAGQQPCGRRGQKQRGQSGRERDEQSGAERIVDFAARHADDDRPAGQRRTEQGGVEGEAVTRDVGEPDGITGLGADIGRWRAAEVFVEMAGPTDDRALAGP